MEPNRLQHSELLDARIRRARDPTGTGGIRRGFRAEATRRLMLLQRVTFAQLVQADFMGHKDDPIVTMLGAIPDPGLRYAQFQQWFKEATHRALLTDNWWWRYLANGWMAGIDEGSRLVRIHMLRRPELPRLYEEAAKHELEGIAAAIVQNASRSMSLAARNRARPLNMHRAILQALRKVGANRLKAWVNTTIVQISNAGRIEAFRMAGVDKVGVIPERLPSNQPPGRPHKDHSHHFDDQGTLRYDPESGEYLWSYAPVPEEWDVLTAGDDRVCPECEAIAMQGPYELDEAQDLIPAHPNCRCAVVPHGEYTQEELLGESSE